MLTTVCSTVRLQNNFCSRCHNSPTILSSRLCVYISLTVLTGVLEPSPSCCTVRCLIGYYYLFIFNMSSFLIAPNHQLHILGTAAIHSVWSKLDELLSRYSNVLVNLAVWLDASDELWVPNLPIYCIKEMTIYAILHTAYEHYLLYTYCHRILVIKIN